MQTRLSKIFLYANATLKPISEDAGTFLWVPLSSEIFILVPIIPPSGEERDDIRFQRYLQEIFPAIFLFLLLFVQKRKVAGGREGYMEKMER